MGIFDSVKGSLDAKEAELKGEKWISKVKDKSTGQWKDLDGWTNVYEPKAEKKEESKQEKAAKSMALDLAFDKVGEGLTAALIKIMMEAAATILGKASQVILAVDPTLAKVLSSTSAIILTFRFDTKSTNKTSQFAFLRKAACRDLTEILHVLISDKGAAQITADIKTQLDQQKTANKSMIIEKVEQLVGNADAMLDAKVLEVEGKLGGLKVAADGIVGADKLTAAKAKADEATGGAMALPDKDAAKVQKDDAIAQFLAMFKEILVSKMEQIDEMVEVQLEKFIKAVEMASKMHGNVKGKKTPEEMADEMSALTETQYKEAQKRVSIEVRRVLNIIKAMVINAQLDNE